MKGAAVTETVRNPEGCASMPAVMATLSESAASSSGDLNAVKLINLTKRLREATAFCSVKKTQQLHPIKICSGGNASMDKKVKPSLNPCWNKWRPGEKKQIGPWNKFVRMVNQDNAPGTPSITDRHNELEKQFLFIGPVVVGLLLHRTGRSLF